MSENYAVVAVSDLSGLWAGLKGLAACREYRDVCLFAGTRLVASLAPEESRLTQLAVAKALPLFDPAPLSPLPLFSFQTLRGNHRRWQEISEKLDKLPPVIAAPTERMKRSILPHLSRTNRPSSAVEPAFKKPKYIQ